MPEAVPFLDVCSGVEDEVPEAVPFLDVCSGVEDEVPEAVPFLDVCSGVAAVERATPGEEVPGSIPAVAARSLQVGSVSV